jgi:NADH-quinone oxidoreductase subunit L
MFTPHSAVAILLLMPLLSAFVILALSKPLGTTVCKMLSVASATLCFVFSLVLLLTSPATPGDVPSVLFSFLNVGPVQADIGYILDLQSRGMLFIVTFVGLLVHVYSLGYMAKDASQSRYFGSLSMFMFSMTGIVLADNFLMMFIFWELVGLSSYLLIGHWFDKASAAEAAKKAFLTNRIGDFGFMIGILVLFVASNGETSFAGLQQSLTQGALDTAPAWVMTLAALGIFAGAVGKSAQAPLHVWLPDAMEGPTPVSALIHAATMVAAGVYMLVRTSFILTESAVAMQIIAGIGAVTALMAALMATQQNDIKRILAYSTLSQLGYMVMAVGLGAGAAAMFHLYTHAFFKALLFLGAGAVIYACHHEQDIWKMGGLNKKTPATFLTFVIGTLALMGFPLTSGFFSKEEILMAAHHECGWCFWIAAFTAMLTSFYMTRCVVVAFLGKARSEDADHAHEAPLIMIAPLLLLSLFALGSGYHMFSDALQALRPPGDHGEHATFVMGVSIAALVVGSSLGFFLYKGKERDPLNIKLFANRFYVDEVYSVLIKVFQDGLAWLVSGLEYLFADGIVARLPAALARAVGSGGRAMQSGQLQGYTFGIGAGLIVAIYYLLHTIF